MKSDNLNSIIHTLQSHKDPEKAKILSAFFKTRKGEYGEGDVFLGITVPTQRKIAREFKDLSLKDMNKLLRSKTHEHRLTALIILTNQYTRGTSQQKSNLVKFYLAHIRFVNNWDLVDSSAPHILGNYLLDKNRVKLYTLAKSKNLWERRIAIVATYAFIKNNDFKDTLELSKMLMKDPHDLIHKATGWMLRELGKRDIRLLEQFLNKHAANMPRTMLRYAIERMPDTRRKYFMSLKLKPDLRAV